MTADAEELGRRIGEIIISLVDLIAEIDGVSRRDVLEELFGAWWVDRITEPE